MGLVYGAARWTIRLTVGLVALLMTTKIIGGLWQRPMLMWIDGLSLGSMDLILGEIRTEPLAFENPALIWGVSWSRDGRWLAITRSSSNRHQHFVLEIIDLRTRNVVCEIDSAYEPPATYEFWYPVWRQNELLLQATFGTQQTNLYRIDPVTCRRTQWTDFDEIVFIDYYVPNTDYIVISTERFDGYWLELWNSQTSQRTPLNHQPLQPNRYWSWSRDRRWLLFGDYRQTTLYNPYTGEMRPQEALYGRSSWSNDAILQTWRLVDKNPALYELQLWHYSDGQFGARVLYEKAYHAYSGRWTQDQTMFAYISGVDRALVLFNAASGTTQRIGGDDVRLMSWSPDNQWLVFSDINGLHRWNRETGDIEQLLPPPNEGHYGGITWWGERLFVETNVERFYEYLDHTFNSTSRLSLINLADATIDWSQDYNSDDEVYLSVNVRVGQPFTVLRESGYYQDCLYLLRQDVNVPETLHCIYNDGVSLLHYTWLP